MSTRVWPYPDLRDGITVNLVTDSHFGRRDWTPNHEQRIGTDLDELSGSTRAFVHAGDGIHWDAPGRGPEDDEFAPWLTARASASTKPWLKVPGNHDMASYVSPFPNRTGQQWAATYGMASQNNVMDLGDMRIIGVGPDSWPYDANIGNWQPMPLSTATLTWLDQQLTAAGSNPCWVAAHTPIQEQYPGHLADPGNLITDLLSSHTNVVGWLSGHRHANINTDPAHVQVVTVGSRRIFTVNGPAAGGLMMGATSDQWGNPARSMFITYTGPQIVVRWREHLEHRWATSQGNMTRTLTLAA